MQRLASVDRSGLAEGPIKAAWEPIFLNLLYSMCTTVCPEAPQVLTHPPPPLSSSSEDPQQ